MRIQGIKGLNWLMYQSFCARRNLSKSNFKSLKMFMDKDYHRKELLKNEIKAL